MSSSEQMVANFNESTLKSFLTQLEKKHNDNQLLRIKHFDDPSKFLNSETNLYLALEELQRVATQPELFHILIQKKTLSTLISLLGHDNIDICCKVIFILQELTDFDDSDDQESYEELVKSLLQNNLIDLVIVNLNRLNSNNKDEAQAISNSLSIIENILDYDTNLATSKIEDLIRWMISQINTETSKFSSHSLSIVELLSVLLMNNSENKNHLRESNGIDTLLKKVDYYRAVAPETGDEHEFLEQIINCLCTAVLDCDENKRSLYEEEGIDLIIFVLGEKRDAIKRSNIKVSILKLLNHVLTTEKNEDPIVSRCCERFIEALGLKVLFPIFNNPKLILNPKVKRREYSQTLDEVEEHTSGILLALLKYCQNTDLIQRVLIKFAELDFQKLNRLLELHDKYFRLISNLHQDDPDNDYEKDPNQRQKSSAYFTLRSIDYIILLTCYLGNRFETYDPTSGETLTYHLSSKLLARRPELKYQIVFEVRKHINEVEDSSSEEVNSLKLLLDHFEGHDQPQPVKGDCKGIDSADS